ncbi:hypothetical protein OOK31_03875 [Streptomyces sp. NBC_00249]|uniref:hypothetical protein n=1 Tax=Streptomyces sp. NBC_00249 TaxID=2975690 RepID=UPI0022580662|nr:hypothetical protein [Streptomyces sp. NBC_00249]MCX5193038.1 hypothetical protein [Streptomyces sp. NBC_00249]
MSVHPATGPYRQGPADGLRGRAAVLRERAERLRGASAGLDWKGPQADAFRARVEELAARCAVAAEGLALSADQLDGPAGRR